MPTHLYIPLSAKPTWWERATAHALEVTVSVYTAFLGVIGLLSVDNAQVMSQSALGFLPAPLAYGICLTLLTGGALSLFGLLVRRQNLRRELNIEQLGWITQSLGWITFALCVIYFMDHAIFSSTAGLMIFAGCVWRLIALYRIERALDAVKEVTG